MKARVTRLRGSPPILLFFVLLSFFPKRSRWMVRKTLLLNEKGGGGGHFIIRKRGGNQIFARPEGGNAGQFLNFRFWPYKKSDTLTSHSIIRSVLVGEGKKV